MPRRLFAFASKYRLELITALLALPVAYDAMDNTLPQKRLYGTIVSNDDPSRPPRVGDTAIRVNWVSTPNIRSCPGQVQIEVTQEHNIWPVSQRVAYNPHKDATKFSPPPWPLPRHIDAGDAYYTVTTVWYCTWFEELFDWPVKQVGPTIKFTILPALDSKDTDNK